MSFSLRVSHSVFVSPSPPFPSRGSLFLSHSWIHSGSHNASVSCFIAPRDRQGLCSRQLQPFPGLTGTGQLRLPVSHFPSDWPSLIYNRERRSQLAGGGSILGRKPLGTVTKGDAARHGGNIKARHGGDIRAFAPAHVSWAQERPKEQPSSSCDVDDAEVCPAEGGSFLPAAVESLFPEREA